MTAKTRHSSHPSAEAHFVRRSNMLSLTRPAGVFVFALGLAALTPVGLSAHKGRDQADASESAVKGISTTQHAEIRAFLISRLEARAIGKDLRQIILRRIDLVAAGSKTQEGPTKITSYPSVAQQIAWQYALQDIAAEIRKVYPSRFSAHSISLAPDGVTPPASTEFVLWSIPNIVENAQGAFSFKSLQGPFPAYLASSSHQQSREKGWVGSVRPSPTGVQSIDNQIAKSLVAVGNISTGEGKEAQSNFIVSGSHDVSNALDGLWICALREDCTSIPPTTDARNGNRGYRSARQELFEQLYLTNPYGERSSATAVVQIGEANRLVSIFVGPKDLGYASLENARPFDSGRLDEIVGQIFALRLEKMASKKNSLK